VVKDELEAVSWYRKAAEQGDANAQCNLGQCYAFGAGVVKDESEAVSWYRKAAEQGNANAKYSLGLCYYLGTGVVKNEVEGYKWILLSIAQGYENARKNLSVLENKLTPAQRAEGQRLALAWAAEYKAKKTEAAGTQ
jgi:hypothetical protein